MGKNLKSQWVPLLGRLNLAWKPIHKSFSKALKIPSQKLPDW